MINKITQLFFLVILGLFICRLPLADEPINSWNDWVKIVEPTNDNPFENWDNELWKTPIKPPGSFYILAFKEARQLAQKAWENIGKDCRKTNMFIQTVGDGVDNVLREIGSEYGGRAVEDFGKGYIDGLLVVLDQVANAIQKTPIFTNRVVVNIGGTVCGNAYRMGCESNFFGIASDLCPKYADNPNFMDYYRAGDNGCCAYKSKNEYNGLAE
ncbi:hypothetical protein PN36_10055 [Candidatus Thiomargarita nelsonii]|uniref:Uncharacterized protein n=1 Tax=Candidatus Thiomargarita nelsonii TaxID=1003181 RepID=A0A0A6RSM8_9GAMM|nr:hypothetical protein PN36_10055 [Candidatus Thiomargarita nelsonii]